MAALVKILDNAKFYSKTIIGETAQYVQWILSGGIWNDNETWKDDQSWQD